MARNAKRKSPGISILAIYHVNSSSQEPISAFTSPDKTKNKSLNMTKIAIITVNFHTLSDTLELLKSLKNATLPKEIKLRLYVVDSQSTSDISDKVKAIFPDAKISSNKNNLGFAASNNVGIRQALKDGNDWIVLINNDCYIAKDFFQKLIDTPISKPEIGAVSGLIYFAPGFEFETGYSKKDLGKVIWYGGGFFDWANVLGSNKYVNQVDTGQLKVGDTDFACGAFLITRSDVLTTTGLFNEDYFMYLEDVELSHRIRLAGYKVLFDSNVKLWHKVAQGSSIGSPLNDYFITRNRLLFGMQYTKFRTKFALFRESLRKLINGTKAQKTAIIDYYTHHLGKGSWVK